MKNSVENVPALSRTDRDDDARHHKHVKLLEAVREAVRQVREAAQPSRTEIRSSGLGLSIVRETVELQGGRAWAEYPDDGGSIFVISLPLRRDPGTPVTRRAAEQNHTPAR